MWPSRVLGKSQQGLHGAQVVVSLSDYLFFMIRAAKNRVSDSDLNTSETDRLTH